MEFDYISEEPAASAGQGRQQYLFNKAENLVIQVTADGFCLRSELWLRSYLQTVVAGNPLPGFTHHGKTMVSDDMIRPMIEGLSYKAYVEEKLNRINKAIAMQGEQLMSNIPGMGKGALSS